MLWEIDQSWTLFLDRDGVINQRIWGDYVKEIAEFNLLDGSAEAIAYFNEVFMYVLVVTNQQGIGKGLMSERNLSDIHAYCSELLKEQNGRIDQYYFAPNLSTNDTGMRKPATGMGIQAQKDFPQIDFKKSVMIGDSDSDIEFGRNLGMKTVYVSHEGSKNDAADLTVTSLLAFKKSLES
jgi:D-glycero-D-manno-heptose 1,7-bisphosphate phosphatase